MKGALYRILLTLVILLNLFTYSAAFGQTPKEARNELEKRKIVWSDEEFISRAKIGDTEVLDLFLAAGMNPDAGDREEKTSLMWAASNGHTASAKALLDAGADVNAVNNMGISPLMEASSAGRTEMVRLLIEKGANANSSARDGMTSLMFASSEGHAEIVNDLIDKGAIVNAVNREGRTSLILAASKGHVGVVKTLLVKGADMDIRDRDGLTALMWAESNKHASVVRLLRKAIKEEVYSMPSQTLTNPQLQRDVWNYIMEMELASDDECQERSIINTEIMAYPSRVGINKWAELWHVNRCGQSISYRIEFRPDEKGGTYFKASEGTTMGERGPTPYGAP